MKRKKSYWWILTLLIFLTFIASISLGSVYIPLRNFPSILAGDPTIKSSWHTIIFDLRLPRAFAGLIAGAGLSLSGLQMQTLFRNPLAGPFVLGISSGASLGVAILIMAGMSFLSVSGEWSAVTASTLGAGLVMMLTLALALRVRDVMSLLIIGLMVGSLTGAVVSILQFFSTGEEIQLFLFWTFGSLGGLNWSEVEMMAIVVAGGVLIVSVLSKSLNALLLSEYYAKSVGINLRRTRIGIIISTSMMAGAVTAFCGPIAFIGLAVPHFCRLLFKTSDHSVLIPATMLSGMVIMMICDIIARLPGSEYVLPINAVTSLIGAPVVIWLVLRRGNVSQSF